ncbi:hypothetical protein [Sphingomonas immobilis]|uniref:DUF2946 domain-containing protein n=1 Tax=Sphingomonas immobilis TaxID=3063997 RepID=A0ABT9A0N6_9SPHN|nr:hypothetical protein [Sphingomonas sp. CA1-15]MDO7842556.1 hypothetical protein [Sphingomonas sp. CA1-15]
MLRLLLILLIAFATPAMPAAACESTPPVAMHHAMPGMPHHGERKAPPAEHLCVGCVPVADLDATPLDRRFLLPAPAPLSRIAALPPVAAEGPVPPPPRNV